MKNDMVLAVCGAVMILFSAFLTLEDPAAWPLLAVACGWCLITMVFVNATKPRDATCLKDDEDKE